jgi:signal transduction histidine kinase
MRGHLFWRFGLFFGLLALFVAAAANLLLWVLAGLFGLVGTPLVYEGIQPVAIFFVIALGILLVLRGVRRVTTPLGDMLEAIGRIADGDYTTRMAEHGTHEMRELARAVNRMTIRLQSSDEQRRNLMSDMAHELRTPLTLIQGNLEGVLDGVYPRDDAHLRMVLEETQWLSHLIDDLRTLALSESGTLQLDSEPTDLGALTRDVVAALQGQADAAGIRLQEQIPADLPRVRADPARIREVLMNLTSNALRYTQSGGVVTFRLIADATKRAVVVEVSDTGVGISPAELPHIFDRFYKSGDSRGSGLGLAIARSLVIAHGGEISAASVVGKGTTIRFTLPPA